MDVILVIAGDSVGNLAAFDDLYGMVLAVPPPAHDTSADFQGQHRRSPPLRHVGLRRRLRGVDGGGFAVAGGRTGTGWGFERTHEREKDESNCQCQINKGFCAFHKNSSIILSKLSRVKINKKKSKIILKFILKF